MPQMADLKAHSMSEHDLVSAGLPHCLWEVWLPEPAKSTIIRKYSTVSFKS